MMAHIATWFAAIGCGLMAGIYFTFSAFVMTALNSVRDAEGIAAMQAINTTIVASPFLPLFGGTTLVALGLAGWSVTHWSAPGAAPLLIGGVIYVVGMFLCTAVFNVPLNDELAAVEPSHAEAASVWASYVSTWTLYNHVRTVASTVACGAFILAIVARA